MAGAEDRIKRAVSSIQTIGTVLQWFGWQKAVISLFASAGWSVWAMIWGLPAPVVVGGAACLLVMAAYATLLPALYRLLSASINPGLLKVTHSHWDGVNDFTTAQAACLWCNIEPTGAIPAGAVYAVFSMIKEAIAKKEIQPSAWSYHLPPFLGDERINANTRVSREELKKLAEQKNAHPRFLFPGG